ncbi:MAG: carbohydrate binding family 9 domain-containing protein [Bacteroidales bacterium]|nr:carbohydrate binding family 9 domain-containing protein [Bacteroidales bacterium]
MSKKIFLFILLLVFSTLGIYSQIAEKKTYTAVKTDIPPKIDGILDDGVWKNIASATDFIQFRPHNGQAATLDSKVKIVYDNEAVYIGAIMYDPYPDSILTELSRRDEANNVSTFGIYIDPFNDAAVAYGFFVTAAGVQIDKKADYQNNYHPEHGNNSWDAVWYSKVRLNDEGWTAEFKIPYSALRFPKKEIQLWGINIIRIIKRYKEETTWNFLDAEINDKNSQAGILEGIINIKPPLRLSFIPYLSAYAEKSSEKSTWGFSYKGGMDLKYGINESFTLDMMLVPDFGQVQSDDKILSLDPFEVFYGEKRPFFTEGTELFDKGHVFYSRRIGDQPAGFDSVEDSLKINEKIDENPVESQLINATKVSGKTKKGLGIGLFNAITANTYASVWDTVSGEKRQVLTEPLTNYNMIVLEQSLKNNSYVSFFNTNVLRKGNYLTANVSGTQFKLVDNNSMYSLSGNLTVSQKYLPDTKADIGSKYYLEAEKMSGNFKYGFLYFVETDSYDPNDMGFLRQNNESLHRMFFKYDIYEPRWKIIESYNRISFRHSSLYAPRKFTEFEIDMNSFTTFKNYLSVSFDAELSPVESHDYFEARVPGRVFIKPPAYELNLYISPDYRKKFIVDVYIGYFQSITTNKFTYWYGIEPRLRVNDKFNISFGANYAHRINDKGYVLDSADIYGNPIILFGNREVLNLTNTLNLNYVFNNTSSLSFRLRHYWLWVNYDEFFDLQEDGYLTASTYTNNHDFNYNAFNIDMVYNWEFAPGSELLLVWKNAIFTEADKSVKNYFENLENIFNAPNTNIFTIKVLYYLDYQMLRKKKHL